MTVKTDGECKNFIYSFLFVINKSSFVCLFISITLYRWGMGMNFTKQNRLNKFKVLTTTNSRFYIYNCDSKKFGEAGNPNVRGKKVSFYVITYDKNDLVNFISVRTLNKELPDKMSVEYLEKI